MKKTDIFIISLLVIGALIVVILPKKKQKYNEISSKELIYEINKKERYFTTENVAQFIMDKNPSVILIDMRSNEEYQKYTLQGAINIPYDSLFNKNFEGIIKDDTYKKILFSNGTTLADNFWILTKRANLPNFYVMQGGLNTWFETIIKPQKPSEEASPEEFDLYEFRKGANAFFVGTNVSESNVAAPEVIKVEIKENKQQTGGGCQ